MVTVEVDEQSSEQALIEITDQIDVDLPEPWTPLPLRKTDGANREIGEASLQREAEGMPEQHAAGPELKTVHCARIHRDQEVKGDLLDQLAGIELDGESCFPIDRPKRLPERREAVPRNR